MYTQAFQSCLAEIITFLKIAGSTSCALDNHFIEINIFRLLYL